MDHALDLHLRLSRRAFLGRSALGLGAAALAGLLDPRLLGAGGTPGPHGGALAAPHFPPRAKRAIYLHMSGGPSQIDLFDHKPKMRELHGQDLPDAVRQGQRITGMTSGQARLQLLGSPFEFAQHGESGAWLSELLPYTGAVADDIAFLRAMHTEAINHDPAITYIQTGSQQPGRPGLGAWMSYGLGSENQDLPAFIVFISIGTGRKDDQPLFDRLWGSGFLPSNHQGVKFRGAGDPVLYLNDAAGIGRSDRRRMIDAVNDINRIALDASGDPEIRTRIEQYEMAFRMQASVPELADLSDEPESTFELYGEFSRTPGTFAWNCVMARRLIERGVRFVQLYHRGWDQHFNLENALRLQSKDVDQPSAALITDLKRRGLLDETLVAWGGEFGRTVYCQGSVEDKNHGRDHHGRCFTMWLAGGGIRGGVNLGVTDDFSYNVVKDGVHVHDLNATILRCLGIDHERLTYKFQGRDFRLTDVHGRVVSEILA